MSPNIICTVAILTHNSAATLLRALESVKEFDEILICDGGSTDGTLAIAESFGAQVIFQDKKFLDAKGRIQDFAGVRNQTLTTASNEWFFFLDADEYIGPALAEEIRLITQGLPSACWIPRKYVYQGNVIDCSVAYPSQQMRFFHKAVARTFIKTVHEKIELHSGVIPVWMTNHMFVPVPDTVEEIITKWRGYLEIERTRGVELSVRQWILPVLHDAGIAVLYMLRLLRIVLFCRGTRLPISHELARVWYQGMLIKDSFKYIKKI